MESAFEKWANKQVLPLPLKAGTMGAESAKFMAREAWDAALEEAAKRFRAIPIMVGGSPANKPLYEFLDWLEGRTPDDL